LRFIRNDRPEVRVGLDLQSIEDVEQSMKDFGSRYTRRIFTEHEIESCQGNARVIASGLASRFAAKEAVMKVLNMDNDAPGWKSIEVRRHHSGRPDIVLYGDAAQMARRQHIEGFSVSLSHDGGVAAAAVIATISRISHA